jgi:hypothetical protein
VSNDKRKSHNQSAILDTPRIDEALHALSRQYGRTVLLLDRFAGNYLQESIDALTSPPVRCLMLDDPIFKDDLRSAPLLVELLSNEPAHQDLLAQSISRAQEQVRKVGRPHYVCAWLFADVSLDRLQHALRQRLDARYPRGERIYLRYFDPRVMSRLAMLLGPATEVAMPTSSNLAQLLGPVKTWCQLDREGLLQCHDNARPVGEAFGRYLYFDEIIATAIDRVEAINLTARELIQRAIPCKQSDDAVIDMHLVQAQKLGLHDADDLVAYAWRAMKYGVPFTLQPALHELIMQAASHGIPLDTLLAEHFPPDAFAGPLLN